jgi:hypothetical protein
MGATRDTLGVCPAADNDEMCFVFYSFDYSYVILPFNYVHTLLYRVSR